MNHPADFRRLESFRLSDDESLERAGFRLVLPDANLVKRSKEEITAALPASADVPGVYFWLMNLGSATFKIYAGKTRSLKRRIDDYMKGFQPHSPNDYKIRIFQDVVLKRNPSVTFTLHFFHGTLENYSKKETDTIKAFQPLLNRKAQVDSLARDSFKQAFEAYYREGFERDLE